jgi:hypothetical protein
MFSSNRSFRLVTEFPSADVALFPGPGFFFCWLLVMMLTIKIASIAAGGDIAFSAQRLEGLHLARAVSMIAPREMIQARATQMIAPREMIHARATQMIAPREMIEARAPRMIAPREMIQARAIQMIAPREMILACNTSMVGALVAA